MLSLHNFPLFPLIHPAGLPTIHNQVDLQGGSIEVFSHVVTFVALLKKSDPKGWPSKSSTPQQMIIAVVEVGEFVIRYGRLPVMACLDSINTFATQDDHDHGNYFHCVQNTIQLPVITAVCGCARYSAGWN
jgi:hypothetical protein